MYGLALAGPIALPCPRAPAPPRRLVKLAAAGPARFAGVRPRTGASRSGRSWFTYRRLPSGATYLRWRGLFEFLVSADGHDIRYRSLPRATPESFTAYLLGQVLSFSLLAFGVEPLHGTVVVVDGEAIAFLGDCGSGKSTLGAAFLRRGHSILTDDLMVLVPAGSGYTVQPGMPRIKLFPGVARRVLGVAPGKTRLNDGTAKRILPLGTGQAFARSVPLRAIYVLDRETRVPRRPAERIAIEPLSAGTALLEVIRNSFNAVVLDADRLAGQFAFATSVVEAVNVRRLRYPRRLARLPDVCEAVLADSRR